MWQKNRKISLLNTHFKKTWKWINLVRNSSFSLTHHLGISYCVKFWKCLDSIWFQAKWRFSSHGNWKNQNPGAVLELPPKQHCQCCLAGSSKTALKILIFFQLSCYRFEVETIKIWASASFKSVNSFVATLPNEDRYILYFEYEGKSQQEQSLIRRHFTKKQKNISIGIFSIL